MSDARSDGSETAPVVMRTPRSLDIEITARCNLRCRYCSFFGAAQPPLEDLPTEQWLGLFTELGRAAVMRVCLSGGEPFIRTDLPTLIDGIVQNHMRFTVLSNGALIDDDVAERLAESRRCDGVQISVDGSCAEVHDALRGRGAFDGALRGLRTLRRHGVPVAVRVTIHRRNVDDLEACATLLLDELGLSSFSTNAAGYLGLCQQHAPEVLLSPLERQRAVDTLARLDERYPGRLGAQAGPLADLRRWREMERAHERGDPAFAGHGHLTGCGCTFNKLAVRADGVYVPCSLLPHLELGRVGVDAMVEVWQRSALLNRMRRRSSISLEEFEYCSDCTYLGYCTGNCPALAYQLLGELDHPSPDACLRRFLKAGGHAPPEPLAEREPSSATGSNEVRT